MKKFYFLSILVLTMMAVMLPQKMVAQNVSIWNGSSEIWSQGQGTQSSPYLIVNAQQLAYIAEMVNGGVTHYDGVYFKLTTDVYIDGNTVWQPIGQNETYYFGGYFDGDNHTVTLYLTTSSMQYLGIFGYAKNGSLSNLNSAGQVNRTSAASNAYAGGICGYSTSSITNCYNTSIISSKSSSGSHNNCTSYAGGICGYSTSSITNCNNTGNISSTSSTNSFNPISYAGGICGSSTSSITNCNNTGTISSTSTTNSGLSQPRYANSYAGGICGSSTSSTSSITNCYNTGNVSTTTTSSWSFNAYAGGICGTSNYSNPITSCYNTGNITSSSSSSSTNSSSSYESYSYSGGICGSSSKKITRCYNWGDISATSAKEYYAYAYAGGVSGCCSNTIFNSYNTGNLSSNTTGTSNQYSYTGGISGYVNGTGSSYTIKNCYNVGSLLSGANKGGISGYSGTITNCHYLNTCGHTASTGGTAKSEAQMKSSSFPVILNTDSVVFVIDITPNINQGYPVFGSVSTQAADNVGATIATLHGTYQMLYDVDAHGFEYKKSSESSYTSVNTTGESPISYNVSGLQGGTAYTYRFFVQKDGIIYRGADKTFTTAVCSLAVQVTATPAKLCDGDTVTYTAVPTGGTGYQYSWSNGSHSNAIGITTDATYTVTVTDNLGCQVTASKQLTMYPAAVASISGSAVLCNNGSTTLTANGGTTYLWSTGSSQRSITVSMPGTYVTTVTTVHGCTASDSVVVSNFVNPSILGETNFCSGGYTTLTVTGGDNYLWSTGATSATINVNTAGNYSVTASTSNGCSGSSSVNVVENQPVNVTITGNSVICNETSTTLTATSGASYLWSSGETTQSISVNTPGNYSVTVTSTTGCSGSSSQTVTMMEPAVISGSTHICEGESVTLSVSSTGTYTWSNGAHTSSITVSTPGTYTVSVSLPNGCSSNASVDVTVATTPIPTILGNSILCQGQTTTLIANGGISYAWNNGGTSSSISVNQSGIYTVTATNTEGCSATANVTVTVNPLPNVSISGNSNFCQGGDVQLTATGANTYEWSNTSTNAAITVSSAGTFTVTGTDANGCSNIATKTVTVNPIYNISLTHSICQGDSYNFYGQNLTAAGTYTHTLQTVNGCDSVLTLTFTVRPVPTPTISGNTTLCQGQSTTLTVNGGVSYTWSNGSTGNSVSVSQSGVYTVTATNAEGCSAAANVSVTVNPLPNVSISGSNSFCQGDNTTLTATGANSYVWSNTSNNATITVVSAGIYTVTGTDANGCSSTATKTVTVNPTYSIPLTHSICQGESYNFYGQNLTTAGTYTHTLQTVNGCDSVLTLTLTVKSLPTPSITGNITFCQGQNSTLTATGGNSYLWNNGSTNNSISVSQNGVYTVTATNVEGCSAITSATVTVNPLPNVSISGNSSFCQGDNTTLTVTGANSYVWNNGSTDASITVNNAGTYTVTGTDANGCSNIATKTVSVNPTYNIPLTQSICQDESYNFYGQNLTTAGTYTHTLQTVNGCDSVLTLTLTVKSLPTPSISGNTTLCDGENTSLTANGGATYLWSNGSTSNNINVSQSGVYTVTATNAEGCSTTANITVTVNPLPNVTISGNNSFCQGGDVQLTATGASTYEWNNGSTNTAITVNNAGTYTVTGTDANGCSSTATKTITVNPTYNIPLTHSICQGESYYFYGQNLTTAGSYTHTLQTVNGCDSVLTLTLTVKSLPTPSISGNSTICEGESTTLTANGGATYLWSSGSTNNTVSVSQSGVYTVTVTNTDGCSATTNVTVTVNPLPNVSISGNNSFCQGDNTTLTVTGASTYVWNNSSSNTSITVNNAGTYTVTGTDANGCSSTATKTITVNPTYDIPLTQSICQGESYNFYGQNLTTAGTYTHTLQTVNGCDSVLTLTLTVKSLPTPSISGNTTLCDGESTTLTANGGNSYLWNNSSTNNSISVSQSGVYTVTATNVEGCSASANITVTVNPLPNITINGNTTICEGSSTTLTASGADSYIWSTGDNTASANISAFGIYTVTGTSIAGCSNTANVTVLVSQLPVITITGETDICAGESTTLTANGGATYLWSNGTTESTITTSTAGTYQVIGYNEAGCNTTVTVSVNVWQPATSEFSVECPDSCYTWNGQDYCTTGDYTQTLQTVHGCDSVVTLHLTITVGIDDYDFIGDIVLYPNPANQYVDVRADGDMVVKGIEVYDMYGKLVRVSETTHIIVSDFADGIYLVRVTTDKGMVTKRFVKN